MLVFKKITIFILIVFFIYFIYDNISKIIEPLDNTDIHTGAHLGVTALAGKKLISDEGGPLNFIKYIAKKGETLTGKEMATTEKGIVKMVAGEETDQAVSTALNNNPAEIVTPCVKKAPDGKDQLISLGCSLLEGIGLDLLQHGVSGQTIGSNPNMDNRITHHNS